MAIHMLDYVLTSSVNIESDNFFFLILGLLLINNIVLLEFEFFFIV